MTCELLLLSHEVKGQVPIDNPDMTVPWLHT